VAPCISASKWVGHDKASQSFALYVDEVRAVDSELELRPIGWMRQQDILTVLLLTHHAVPRLLNNVRASDILTVGEPMASMTSDSNPSGLGSRDKVPGES
jgi:hypothetical protein